MEENKDKKEIGTGALIVFILGGAVVLVVIVRVLNCCIPSTFKFDVGIWGNVSEWFTFLVALFGGVFIYKTLDSQMKVQKDQNRIFKIEEQKYLRSIKPNLAVKFIPTSTDEENEEIVNVFATLEFRSKNYCNLSYTLTGFDDMMLDTNSFLLLEREIFFYSKIIRLTIPNLNIDNGTDTPTLNDLNLNIYYYDCDGNEYNWISTLKLINVGGEPKVQRTLIKNSLISKIY